MSDASAAAHFEREPAAADLWRRAEHLLATDAGGLRTQLPPLLGTGFVRGARWMEHALHVLRGELDVGARRVDWDDDDVRAAVRRLGFAKYTAVIAAVGLVASLWFAASPARAHAAPLAFGLDLVALPLVAVFVAYLVELQLVFALPAFVDGRSLAASRRLVARRGTLANLPVLLGIAGRMLRLDPADLRRNWARGCLAIVVWYEYECSARRCEVRRA